MGDAHSIVVETYFNRIIKPLSVNSRVSTKSNYNRSPEFNEESVV